jgi:hypothetical protein
MGRKKLTKILLQAGSRLNTKNHQTETPLDISVRKGFNEIIDLFKNPPSIVSPIQRDEIRASKYKSTSSGPSSSGNNSHGKNKARAKDSRDKSDHSDKRSGGGSSGHRKETSKDKSSSKRSGEGGSKSSQTKLNGNNNDIVPNWSPYGCHYHPNPEAFPPPKIDSLPPEPLRSGELYYLDLAGNIHKVSVK